MARTPNTTTAPAELLTTEAQDEQQLVALQSSVVAQEAQLHQLAHSLGYQGSLTVGGLEDEIRFYQRRSVEALLECGKRLLLLKEITPHGEFMERVEDLGFAERTARRFMQAAAKAAKSATVAVLAGQVKNQKAFFEIITHDDDDDLKRLSELDNVDCMSASQLREALRDIQAEHQATQTLADKKQERIERLERQVLRVQSETHDERLSGLREEATKIATATEGMVLGELRAALEALQAHGHVHADNPNAHHPFMAGLLGQVQRQLNALREQFSLPDAGADTTPAWQQWANGQDAQAAAQAE